MEPVLKRTFTFRIADETWEKFHVISKLNKRSVNSQLELLVEQCIAQFESENGKIVPDKS
jgi:hypothetical protein